jgi:GNAT superfamily N-acetyltransferase
LYQTAAEKWVKQGILSHAIALYAHNNEAVDSFYWNGFGLRTIDAIRVVEPIVCSEFPLATFYELPINEIAYIVSLKNDLIEHLCNTPMFMPLYFKTDVLKVTEENERRKSRYFVAKVEDEVVAFIEIMSSGENFACEAADMTNICGAYMFPQYRKTGIFTKLLAFLMDTLAAEGYNRCGVDFESFNPTASGFWLKHFSAYTYGVVRRIDERIMKNI